MSEVTWVYPASVDELVACLADGARPVGGATGIMRNVPRTGVLADLSGVGIGGVEVSGTTVLIGGKATYAEIVRTLSQEAPDHVLVRALRDAASPALRNIITAGGSVALFPPWSRIVGPLAALDARVRLVGNPQGVYPVTDYAVSTELKERSAVAEITVDAGGRWESHWYRFAPARFNYPLFTVTALVQSDGDAITECRIVITGTRGRFQRLGSLEESLRGAIRADVTVTAEDLGVEVLARQGFSADYLTHLAAVELARAIRGARRSEA